MQAQVKLRLRAPNFTYSENLLLCDCIKKRKSVIENKKLDRATILQKQNAWVEVAEEFNTNSTGYCRTVESLQQNYKNLKKKLRKKKQQLQPKETDEFKAVAFQKTDAVSGQNELLKIQLIDEQERLDHNRLLRKMELDDVQRMYEHNETIRKLQLEKVFNSI